MTAEARPHVPNAYLNNITAWRKVDALECRLRRRARRRGYRLSKQAGRFLLFEEADLGETLAQLPDTGTADGALSKIELTAASFR